MDLSKCTKTQIKDLVGKEVEWMANNIHKFSQQNRIKVGLALITKYMPTQIEGNLNITKMPCVTIDGKDMEMEVG